MIYTGSIDVSADTSENSPEETSFKVTAGVIHHVGIEIPPGHAGLTGIAFYIGGHQIYPSTQGQWFRGDNRNMVFKEWLTIRGVDNKITVKAFNTDETFSHIFNYEFGVLKDWQLTPWLSVNRLIKWLKIFLGHYGMG